MPRGAKENTVAQQQQKSHGHKGNKAAARHRELYKRQNRRLKNKLHRIRQSNGHKACQAYAAAHGMTGWTRSHGLI